MLKVSYLDFGMTPVDVIFFLYSLLCNLLYHLSFFIFHLSSFIFHFLCIIFLKDEAILAMKSHFVSFVQFAVATDVTWTCNSSAEKCSGHTTFGETFNPTHKTIFCT